MVYLVLDLFLLYVLSPKTFVPNEYDFNGDDFDSIDNNGLIEEIKKKFNEIAQEITEEKEDFD